MTHLSIFDMVCEVTQSNPTVDLCMFVLHSFTPRSKPTFSTNPSHLNTFLLWSAFAITVPDRISHAA